MISADIHRRSRRLGGTDPAIAQLQYQSGYDPLCQW